MKVLWLARTLLVLLALGLAGNTFVGTMSSDPSSQRGAVSTVQTSSPMNAGIMAGGICCLVSSTCAAGSGAVCGGLALDSKNGWALSRPSEANTGLPEMVALVTPQTSIRLFRPPRA